MDERGWLGRADPQKMLESLRGKASDRKLRLFAVACCRMMWAQLRDQPIRRLVEQAERFADGMATADELRAARSAAEGVLEGWRTVGAPLERPFHTHAALVVADVPIDPLRLCGPGSVTAMSVYRARAARRAGQRAMLRDILGNPFRPVTLDPSWLTPDVLSLAQAAYENRTLPAGTLDPTRLALLADALTDAGCTDENILGHLRGEGPHVRGCFAVDLVLGRE
jgi:hypothetical protein